MTENIESLKKSLTIYRGLVEVSSLINSITDFDQLLRAILDIARRVMQAEAASLFLVDDATQSLELIIASFNEGVFVEPHITVPKGRGISGWVKEHKESVLIPDAYKDPRFFADADKTTGFHSRSILCAPLFRGNECIGVLQVLNSTNKDCFEAEDLEGFIAYSNLISTAIEKLRTIERILAQERVERDLTIAAEIQREILSQSLPDHLENADFAAYNLAAQNVGGDFYDVFQKDADTIYFAIGDVSGKGIPAALLMAQTLSALQFVFRTSPTPAQALEHLNETVQGKIIRGMFVTVIIGRLTPSTHRIEIASAGHCAPFLVSGSGIATVFDIASSMPIGIQPGVKYEQTEASLKPSDLLVLYTDGLSESRDPQTEQYFDDLLLKKLSRSWTGPTEIVETLALEEKLHRRDTPQRDDLTILSGGFRKVIHQKHMKFTSDSNQLSDIRSTLRTFLEKTPLSEMDAELIILAVDEACTNVIRHAYDNKTGEPIDLKMSWDGHRLKIQLKDLGKACDPASIRSRELEDVRPGGVGVHIIKNAFDSVTYTPQKQGMELVLIKKVSS
ncbi:MAG: SpoIIE family protein phosphatase [Chthoniobacterales bacterium]